jgi:hypothetical protein
MRTMLLISALLLLAASGSEAGERTTVLAISGERFLLNGKPGFLLGFSYFAALGAPKDFITQDLDDFQKAGFNWLRVWATWSQHGTNISVVAANGDSRTPFLQRLEWLVAECDRRGMVVDVTLTRGKRNSGSANSSALPDFRSHQQAVRTLTMTFKAHRNWFLDLANEHDVGDDRFVPDSELAQLRQQVRDFDPGRLVTASYGGHDLTEEQIRAAIETLKFDFICPHRPRSPESPGQTEAKTRELLAIIHQLRHSTPVLYQEPFRRGYGKWEPNAADFLTDLAGAVSGGAAGWCFHNGSERQRSGPGRDRSFDLSARRLFEQLDSEELRVVSQAAGEAAREHRLH